MSQTETVPTKTPTICFDDGLLPLHILNLQDEVPESLINSDNGSSFVLQGMNMFMLHNYRTHSILTPVDKDKNNHKFLSEQFGECKYSTDKLYLLRNQFKDCKFNLDDFRQVMKYFQAIYDKHKSEAAVLLLLNPDTKLWKILYVLQASAAGGSVVYIQPVTSCDNVVDFKDKRILEKVLNDPEAKQKQLSVCEAYNQLYNEGYRIWGTIHSHCNFGAFHSGTDDNDELNFDGLHITIGKVRSGWDFACRYMIKKHAITADIKNILHIENMEELYAGLDDVTVSDDLMSLMMPNLVSYQDYAVKPELVQHDWNGWESATRHDDESDVGNYLPYRNPYSAPYSVATDPIWQESHTYRLYNWTTGQVVYTKLDYYRSHRHLFDCYYIIDENKPIPAHAIKRHEAYIKSLQTPANKVKLKAKKKAGRFLFR